ncbi:hypothetical protein [Streptomyces cadmiisoli]|nr:hypothetical protein [Streptomyces cadmiisoli]
MRGHVMWWKDSRRELAALAAVLAAALALLMGSAPVASAGGPTSVLIVSPESTRTAALYSTDEEYDRLQQLLGEPSTATAVKPPEADLSRARLINVTWMVHDVSPWRYDQVYPSSEDGKVWIHTSRNLPDTVNGVWHRAERPAELRTLLEGLGVLGPAAEKGSGGVLPQDGPSQESAAGDGAGSGASGGEAAASPTGAAAAGAGSGWWWALPGAAAGAVLALVLRPFAGRVPLGRLRPEPGPRQELRDI